MLINEHFLYQKNANLPTNKNFGLAVDTAFIIMIFFTKIKLFLFLVLFVFILGLFNSKYLTYFCRQYNNYKLKYNILHLRL